MGQGWWAWVEWALVESVKAGSGLVDWTWVKQAWVEWAWVESGLVG